MYIEIFRMCDDCSKKNECDQCFSPGCHNYAGFVASQKRKERNNG